MSIYWNFLHLKKMWQNNFDIFLAVKVAKKIFVGYTR